MHLFIKTCENFMTTKSQTNKILPKLDNHFYYNQGFKSIVKNLFSLKPAFLSIPQAFILFLGFLSKLEYTFIEYQH